MPVYATRKLRNLAATLMLLSGLSHVGQLWFRELDGMALITALLGMFYLVLALGLSGQSRFTLWVSSVTVCASGMAGSQLLDLDALDPLLAWHLAVDALVVPLCLYVLFRTRHSEMD